MNKTTVQEAAEKIKKITRGVKSFAAEMKRKQIHVGLGNPPICMTCGKPWKECQKK